MQGRALKQIDEWQNVDRTVFENDIFAAKRPAVLRGLVRHWPAVQAGRQSRSSLVDYFKRLDTGVTVNAMVGPPEIEGRFFYSDDYLGFNFGSRGVSISSALDSLASLADDPQPPAIVLQAMHVPDIMPAFPANNRMPLLDSGVAPRIWIGNRSMIAAHFDNNHNIACVVGGSRRFTVFPPDQVGNLYIGPLLRTPGGSPVSTVDLRQPDLARFPRFREALESAEVAVLEPGDAIFIPIMWWHGVESLDPLNVLANYWWNDAAASRHKPILALVHTIALLSGLPADQRDVWRRFFEHFAFRADGDPAAHLPADLQDALGDLSPADRDRLVAFIAERMKT